MDYQVLNKEIANMKTLTERVEDLEKTVGVYQGATLKGCSLDKGHEVLRVVLTGGIEEVRAVQQAVYNSLVLVFGSISLEWNVSQDESGAYNLIGRIE